MTIRTMFVTLALILSTSARAAELTVSAASSLQAAMTAIAEAYEAKSKDKVTLNFGASGVLGEQINQGAPVDVFVSAAEKPVDDLTKSGKLLSDTRLVIAGNKLVLVVPAANGQALKSFTDLSLESIKKIAVGEPKSVPAGQYAADVFKVLKLPSVDFDAKLVFASNVRQVLTYVETANVDAGVVYATDAAESGKVRVVAEADAAWHEPIVYPAAVVKTSKSIEAARAFAKFLGEAEARAILMKLGFTAEPGQA